MAATRARIGEPLWLVVRINPVFPNRGEVLNDRQFSALGSSNC